MRIQAQRLILGQYPYRVNPRIDAVAQRKVNDAILTTEGNRRFCYLRSQHAESASLSSCQKHGYHFFFNHAITSCCNFLLVHIIPRFFSVVNIFYNFFHSTHPVFIIFTKIIHVKSPVPSSFCVFFSFFAISPVYYCVFFLFLFSPLCFLPN